MIVLKLTPDYCCGGGHCGPMPGYYYKCPHCGERAQCRTYYQLQEGNDLECDKCGKKIKAVNKKSEFEFEFEMVDDK